MQLQLSPQAKALWAKKSFTNNRQFWLPLVTHLTDTMNVINWLFNHWIPEGQRKAIMGSLSEEETQKLLKFLGFTHDIGKAAYVFQIKPGFDHNQDLDDAIKEKLYDAGFNPAENSRLIKNSNEANAVPHAMAGEALLMSYGVPISVSAIVGGHHGNFLESNPKRKIRDYRANFWQTDNDSPSQRLWQSVQKEIFDVGLQSAGYGSVKEIPKITQPQSVLTEGLLITSDWLASSEYLDDNREYPLFPLVSIDETIDSIDAQSRFEQAIIQWDKAGKWIPRKINDGVDPYKQRWGFTARPEQKTITEAIGHANDPEIVIIEAPMGIGKTETALIASEQLAYKSGMDGLYFGLPTQATSNAMFARVNQWVEQLPHEDNLPYSMHLMHGKAQFNQVYRQLRHADTSDMLVAIDEWFSGKKQVLDEFTVGTVDNLLNLALKQKHLALKHLGFSNKVVVVDEVHAYDTYMDQYLYRALLWLGVYKVPVVILSATLPREKRVELIEAYRKGRYPTHKQNDDDTPNWRTTETYPLLTMLDDGNVKQTASLNPAGVHATSKVTVERFEGEDSQLIDHILHDVGEGGVAGVIVNTVKRAQTLAQMFKEHQIPFMILHSALLAPERAKREEKLQKLIGKHGKRPAKMVVIGTQVLEQSLDIDFDVLYSDIAPVDLLLQRAGRMHRHAGVKRPKNLMKPKLVVIGSDGDDGYGGANEAIYSRYLLLRTDYYLQQQSKQYGSEMIAMPNDISKLVQLVYDDNVQPPIDGLAEAQEKFKLQQDRKAARARVYRLAEPSYKKSAHKWAFRGKVDVDKDDNKASAAVRDIEESLEVVLVTKRKDGWHLLDGRSLEECESFEIAQQLVRLPVAVTREIDKTIRNLEESTFAAFSSWQNDSWLKGVLTAKLDENDDMVIAGYRMHYSNELGLMYEKEVE